MLIESINKAWGWLGIHAVSLIDENDFGNIIFQSSDGTFWRILPENPECLKIADTEIDFQKLRADNDFIIDWKMEALVSIAELKYGKLEKGRKYCLKIPSFLGGEYTQENIGTVSFIEQIEFSGDVANQIHDLPDGTKFTFEITP